MVIEVNYIRNQKIPLTKRTLIYRKLVKLRLNSDHIRILHLLSETPQLLSASQIRDLIAEEAEKTGFKSRSWYPQIAAIAGRLAELHRKGLVERVKQKAKDRHGRVKWHYRLSRLGRRILKKNQPARG